MDAHHTAGPLLLAALLALAALPAQAAPAPAAAYADQVLAEMRKLTPLIPAYHRVARDIAPHLEEGTLWLAGDRGFVLEALNRAGGLMACKWLKKPEDLKAGDVVLYGMIQQARPEDVAFLNAATETLVWCVAMGPAAPEGWSGLYLPVPAPPAADPARLPTISPVLTAATWVFTAELLDSLMLRGKMPPMYQSVLVPGGRERNAERLKLKWEPQTPTPAAPGEWGRVYLARVSNMLRTLRATQTEKFVAAGQLAAAATRGGHTAWYASLGHLPPELPGQVGDPGVLKPLKMSTPDKLADFVKPGDVILYVGYYEPYGPWVEKAHELGAKIVTVVSGTPERRAENMGADININACWPYGDAVLEIPGYDIKVLPPSGVVAATAYWMLVAETAAALAG